MNQAACNALFWPLAALASFYPLILSLAFRIWPPTAMVHEVFGTNYYAFPFVAERGFFIETGYGALLFLAYPAYALASLLVPPSNAFAHMAAFGTIYYLIVGTIVFAIGATYLLLTRRPGEALLLFLLPVAPSLLEPETNLDLMINYGKAQEIVGMAVAALVLLRNRRRLHGFTGLVVTAASLLAFATVTKFSNLLVFGPVILAALAIGEDRPKQSLRLVAITLLLSVLLFLLLAFAYNQFSVSHGARWAQGLVRLYMGGHWLKQRTPFLAGELAAWHPSSFYVALKILIGVTGLLLLIGSPWWRHAKYEGWWWRPSISIRLTILLGSAALLYMLIVRQSQGTMIDVSVFTTFAFVLLWATREAGRWRETVLRTVVAASAVAVVVSASLAVRPAVRLDALSRNSAEARRFDAFVSGSLPKVFYMKGLPQPLLFPSADQICLYKASASPASAALVSAFCPQARSRSRDDGLVAGPHIAIIPEFEGLPETPELQSEWPEHWRREMVDRSRLDPGLRLATATCKIFTFREVQPMAQSLLYYSTYPMTVTACRVP